MVDLKLQIPHDFLKEETRCGYTITKEMKELWAVELDLVMELDRVCRKYGLKYSANGGTVLGVVRHQGFIPWDDDIDVMMPRADYEKLIKIGSKEFVDPYFLESMHSDENTLMWFAKLKNSNTAAIEYPNNKRRNQGVFIDIFPLDNVIDDPVRLRKQRKHAAIYRKISNIIGYCISDERNDNNESFLRKTCSRLLHLIFKVLNIGRKQSTFFFYKSERIIRRYNSCKTKYISTTVGLELAKPIYTKVLTTDFDCLKEGTFEFVKLPIMEHYAEYLTMTYGDWHKYVIGTSLHSLKKIDTGRSYKEVLDEIEK